MIEKSALPALDIRRLYIQFNAPVTEFDCGEKCAPNNPRSIPFCCDICQAVPAVYHQEWVYLKELTDLWHAWRGDECPGDTGDPLLLCVETPEHMQLLACKGPQHCQRPFRALSCRQFPFFPYITSNQRFIGLAGEWEFEDTCWVLSHLEMVTATYRQEFIRTYDELFDLWEEEFDSYALKSEQTRLHFAERRRRFPLLHRNGKDYLVSHLSERLERIR
jgi:hypothetical protein